MFKCPAVALLHRIREYPQVKNTFAVLIPLTKNSQKEEYHGH